MGWAQSAVKLHNCWCGSCRGVGLLDRVVEVMEGVVGGVSEVVSSWVGCGLGSGWEGPELRMLSLLLGDCGEIL